MRWPLDVRALLSFGIARGRNASDILEARTRGKCHGRWVGFTWGQAGRGLGTGLWIQSSGDGDGMMDYVHYRVQTHTF